MITTRLPAARDRRRRGRVGRLDGPVGQGQELHGLVDAGQLSARDGQVARHGGADRNYDRVMRARMSAGDAATGDPGLDGPGWHRRPASPSRSPTSTPHTNSVPSSRI